MISLLAFFSCMVSVTIALTITRDGFYDTKYNHLDIGRVLNNKRLVMYYGQCLLGEGPCTPQGTEFKRILPEAMQTNCARCTEKQKVTAYLAIRRLKKEYPTIWQKMQANWDPTGELVSRFINDVETKSTLDGIVKIGNTNNQQQVVTSTEPDVVNNEVPQNVFNRFGEETTDNEINTGSSVTINPNQITQTKAPVLSAIPLQNAQVIPNIPSVTAFNNNQRYPDPIPAGSSAPQVVRDTLTTTTTRPTIPERVYQTTIPNYRISNRPNRIVLIPRPIDFGRLTSNVFAQVADVGTKVIRTGVRIADMVLRPIFNNNTNNNRN